MKKLLLAGLFLFPTLAFAQTVSFQNNLSYGSTGTDVSALQEFLVTQHLLAPQYVTGNFYSLTLAAVKSFQTAESISPISGFVGPITRSTINTILASQVSDSEENAATSTPPIDLSQSTTTPVYTPPQVIYVPVPQPTPVFTGVTQTPQVTIPSPTCTVAMGVNIAPSSFVMDRVAGIVQWTSANTVSGTLVGPRTSVTLSPASGGTISDFTIAETDQPYVATFVGTNGSSVTCTPNFTPATIKQIITFTQAYNTQSQAFGQQEQTIENQAQAQITTLNNSGGEIGFVTGEIAQVTSNEVAQVQQIDAQAEAATAAYNSQMTVLTALQ